MTDSKCSNQYAKFKLYNLICIVVVLFHTCRYLKQCHCLFTRLGIPGPTPTLLFGNVAEFKDKASGYGYGYECGLGCGCGCECGCGADGDDDMDHAGGDEVVVIRVWIWIRSRISNMDVD